jgi:RNA polymerase sigma factor (sigma-70 family)
VKRPSGSASLASSRKRRPSDAELVAGIARGDLAPLGILYDRYQARVRSFVGHASCGAADAEDVAHETFMQLVHVAVRFDGRESALPLLLGIAAQLVRRRRRNLSRLSRLLVRFACSTQDTFELTPEGVSCDREELHRFQDALAKLSDDKRVTFLMVELGGLTGEEAASALGIPVNTVWSRLHYARWELSRTFKRETTP